MGLHPLHRLENGRLGIAGPGRKHLGVDLTDREHQLPRPLTQRHQRSCDLVPAAHLSRGPAPKPDPSARYGGTAVRIRRHHLHIGSSQNKRRLSAEDWRLQQRLGPPCAVFARHRPCLLRSCGASSAELRGDRFGDIREVVEVGHVEHLEIEARRTERGQGADLVDDLVW